MKRALLLGAFAVLLAAATVWLGAVHTDASVLVAESVVDTPVHEVTETEISDPAAPAGECLEADPLSGESELACCIDQCRRDKDCRFVCGQEFGGQCVMVNSCCRECFCFGFAPAGTPS